MHRTECQREMFGSVTSTMLVMKPNSAPHSEPLKQRSLWAFLISSARWVRT